MVGSLENKGADHFDIQIIYIVDVPQDAKSPR